MALQPPCESGKADPRGSAALSVPSDSRTGCSHVRDGSAHARTGVGGPQIALEWPEGFGAKAPPGGPGGALRRSGSVAVGLAAAGPDEGVAFAVLVVEEVREDRRVEARIVQLDREIVTALVGALRPGGPDLGAADVDPVAGGVVVGPVGLGDDADVLGLEAEGDDLALELAADFLKEPMLAMSLLLAVFEPATTAASMAIGEPEAIDDAPARAGAQRRMATVRLSCLARNGLCPGEESLPDAIAAQAIEAQPAFGQIRPREVGWSMR